MWRFAGSKVRRDRQPKVDPTCDFLHLEGAPDAAGASMRLIVVGGREEVLRLAAEESGEETAVLPALGDGFAGGEGPGVFPRRV